MKLPDNYTVEKLKEYFTVAQSEYSKCFKRAKKLDLADKGKLWEAVHAKFPAYQILPDTNFVSYIKQNLLASIYTVGKNAKLIPTSEKDKEIVEQLNIALDNIWGTLDIARYQMLAGERAALINYGITQVGWDNNIVTGTGDTFQKGQVTLKNINPLHFYRDPFAADLDHAAWCCTWDSYHKSVLLDNPKYHDAVKAYIDKQEAQQQDATGAQIEFAADRVSQTVNTKKDYYTVYCYWVNDNGNIHEIHLINNECPILVKKGIKPATFPFAELYCNLPSAGDLFGTSEPAKIFANALSYNIMSSIILTSEYKNQRPPRFINGQSGINVATFTKHGNDADRTFIVNGDASKAVHYQQYPQPSAQATQAMAFLTADVKQVSGVDDRYTGRDTGSILTTGGVESMLDQVTMIDAPKVANYEAYCRRLTNLVISNYLNFGMRRSYLTQDTRTLKWHTVTVDFPKIDADTVFSYEIMISSELPKNKTRVEAVANHLMEMQMQYTSAGLECDLITPEEWLMMQDIPYREYMQERMGIQRTRNWTEMVAQAVTQYTGLISTGVKPEDAIAATADTMASQSMQGDTLSAVNGQMQDMQATGMQPLPSMPTGGLNF